MYHVSRLGCVALFVAAPVWAAEPVPAVGPVPSWVVAAEIPVPDPAKAELPMQFLLTASQQRITADGVESNLQLAAIAQTTAGLQTLGNISLPWNSELSDLTLHNVTIRRGDSSIELLKPNELLVLRRENNLEQAVLDGVRTVVVPAHGLQTGDTLVVSATYRTRKGTIATQPENVQLLTAPMPIARLERRILVPDGIDVRWNSDLESVKPQVTRRDGATEYLFVQTGVEPLKLPDFTPTRFRTPILQMSAYAGWQPVANALVEPFAAARASAADSALAAEADKIAAATSDPGKRALAALRLAQERVRYVALLLGEGAYLPASADETWERKFGDCKGKTMLLLALLDRFGIAAEPVLVSNGFDDRIGNQLPSLSLFDHVIVRATIGGEDYYLDPTDYGQRTLDDVAGTPFSHGLAIRKDASLEALPPITLKRPSTEMLLTWNVSNGTEGPTPFEASLIFRGPAAAELRAKLSAASKVEEFDTSLKNNVPRISNDDLEIVEKSPEQPDGSFLVRFKGEAEMDWSPFEGERNTRYEFSHSAFHWDVDFDRDEGEKKDLPVLIGAIPDWQRMTETLILPDDGKQYRVDGDPVEKSFAGTLASRTFYKDGNKLTMMSEIRHVKREISAEEARAAKSVLEELNDDWAYVVGPPEKKKRRR